MKLVGSLMMRALASAVLAASLAGCAASYQPLAIAVAPSPDAEEAKPRFFKILVDHLALQRNTHFAQGYLRGEYALAGVRETDDGRGIVYLFVARAPGYLLPYAVVFIQFRESPSLVFQKNTSLDALALGVTNDGDGDFPGLFKLTVLNASICTAETKALPEVEGNTIKVKLMERIMRRSMREFMSEHYTPPYCQGFDETAETPQRMRGMRFYFPDQPSMETFAQSLVSAFPFVGK